MSGQRQGRSVGERIEHACYLLMWACLVLWCVALFWSIAAYEA